MEKTLRSKVVYNITEENALQQAAKYIHSIPDASKLAEEIIKKIWAAIHDDSVET